MHQAPSTKIPPSSEVRAKYMPPGHLSHVSLFRGEGDAWRSIRSGGLIIRRGLVFHSVSNASCQLSPVDLSSLQQVLSAGQGL